MKRVLVLMMATLMLLSACSSPPDTLTPKLNLVINSMYFPETNKTFIDNKSEVLDLFVGDAGQYFSNALEQYNIQAELITPTLTTYKNVNTSIVKSKDGDNIKVTAISRVYDELYYISMLVNKDEKIEGFSFKLYGRL